jgi:AcrR family transcriptional regulator
MPKIANQKQHILETALKLFAEHGYNATPISLIAKTAKVSQGLLYNFFEGKEALLQEIILLGFQDIQASMKNYGSIKDPAKAIEIHVTKTVEIIQKKKEFWRLLHAIRLQGNVLSAMQNQFAEIVSAVTQVFEGVFKKLQYPNPKLEAILFLTQIDGMVILYLQDNATPIKKLGQQLIKRYTK